MTSIGVTHRLSTFDPHPNDSVNVNFQDITAYINDRNDGLVAWDKAVIGVSGSSAVNLTINANAATGANTATLTNSPVTGNPATWIQVNINGNNRYIPCW